VLCVAQSTRNAPSGYNPHARPRCHCVRVMSFDLDTKTCEHCRKRFRPNHGNARFCCLVCYMNASATLDPKTGCRIWNGSADTYGYGHARWDGRRRKAHVMAFEMSGRSLKPEHVVRHMCNNTRCCNPEHLVLGTRAENMADKARSGIVAGENCPKALLTNEQAIAIYKLRDKKRMDAVAEHFGVQAHVVRRVWIGESYTIATDATRQPPGRPVGEANHAAKITNQQALAIYARKGPQQETAAQVSREMGIPYSIVKNVWSGKTHWRITGARCAQVSQAKTKVHCVHCKSLIGIGLGNRRYCSLECALMRNVAKAGANDCWPWIAKTKSRAYGQVQFCGQRLFAHQVAFDLANPSQVKRRKARKLTVSHTCHNPLCCNPKHLELLTLKQNVRQNRGRSNVSGESNHQSKMTEGVARRIIELIEKDVRSCDIIRKIQDDQAFSVTMFQVTDIKRGRSWQHLKSTTLRKGRR